MKEKKMTASEWAEEYDVDVIEWYTGYHNYIKVPITEADFQDLLRQSAYIK